MHLAYDYPLLGAMWTTMWLFLWILWFFLLFRIIVDIFRDDSMSGWVKTGWLVFVIVLPFLGVLIYVLARGKDMGKREREHAREQQQAVEDYIRKTAGNDAAEGPSKAEQLAKLSEVKARGDLTDEEFQRAKELILH
ncbi:SHOCT domain-containing protein [Streptomyces sp. NPDC005805]|uniref:SHOCT domain-containing protein n=1 Tax=Streptomyces sp. NPDC005805 TaxID=3157068 RepID=UPI0033F1D23B